MIKWIRRYFEIIEWLEELEGVGVQLVTLLSDHRRRIEALEIKASM